MGLRALRAHRGRALARRDRHLPGAGTPRARTAPRECAGAHRKRARRGRSGGGASAPRRSRCRAGTIRSRCVDAGDSLHGHVRGLSGARPALRGGAGCAARAARRAVRAGRRRARADRRVQDARARPGHRRPGDLHRRAPGERDSGSAGGGGRARVAEKPRHEHAVEDLSVSPLRPRHRGHATAHAHAGAQRRRGDPHRRHAGGVRRRDPAGDRRSGGGGADRRRGGELAATKYSYEAYLARTREAIGRLGVDSRATLSGSAA